MKSMRKMMAAIAAVAVLVCGPAMASGGEKYDSSNGPMLVGTWQYDMTVRFDMPDCKNSAMIPFGPNPFPGMASYHEGGTMTEFASRSPSSVRSTGFGVWKKTGKNRYRSRFTFQEFDANGLLWRTMVISSKIYMSKNSKKYEAVSRLELTDISGNVLNFCATIDANRFTL
ncbi:MAG TPA: hypothetical protein PKK10_16145 [Woeseiaceae bacterium]|nr:hypothetical protein [Woeseiaceae bacterium]